MLLVQYETVNHQLEVLRNNPRTGSAEKTTINPDVLTYLYPDDGAIDALLSLAREVPNQWHTVPNPKPPKRQVWGRLVQ